MSTTVVAGRGYDKYFRRIPLENPTEKDIQDAINILKQDGVVRLISVYDSETCDDIRGPLVRDDLEKNGWRQDSL